MIDPLVRPHIVSVMDRVAIKVSQSGLSANMLTVIGFLFGFAGCFFVGMQMYPLGLLLILIALAFDGLDGAVARVTKTTELGAWLDMMASVLLFAMFPLFFMLSSINDDTAAACILLFTYLIMGMANLSYDYFAMKRGAPPAKSGLVETSEITLFIILSCLYPDGFSFFAAALAIMNLAAASIRMVLTYRLLKT